MEDKLSPLLPWTFPFLNPKDRRKKWGIEEVSMLDQMVRDKCNNPVQITQARIFRKPIRNGIGM